jgi:hypothetical protein
MAKRSSGTRDVSAEESDSSDATDIDFAATFAMIIALAARNRVEDLHASGAFSDQQAPSLNRLLRGRIYELLVATHRDHPGRDDDPFMKYVDHLVLGYTGGHTIAALQGAVARAVDDYAKTEAIDRATATKLRKAAIKGAMEAYKTVNRLSRGRSKDEERDRLAVEFWLRTIPSYWEKPEVSPEFQELLDSSERRGP